ncbi:MAG: cytochrome c3 family protein [Desulfobacterales bacterium]|nr:cytochrome c3 family protein [Desulfobacterales bacterium]
MNTNDQQQPVSDTASPGTGDASGKGKNGSGWIILLFFVIGLIGSLAGGWLFFPDLLYSEKQQPIDFNHKLHMGVVYEGCQSCHYFREDGSFSGIPDLYSCSGCHQYPQGTNPEEKKFIEEYVRPNKAVPWLVYSEQPDCVFFSHAAHVKGADMKCQTCHGKMGQTTHARPYQENRLTGYSRDIWGYNIARLGEPKYGLRMKMNDCAECHKKRTGHKGACFQCHQ